MCWIRHRPPVLIVSWWGPLQWVNLLQPSIRSAGQSFFSLLLCYCCSRGCNMGLLWFPTLSWWFILFWGMTSFMNGTFRSSCRVWLVTYQGAFIIIRIILDWLRCILAIYDLLANSHNWKEKLKGVSCFLHVSPFAVRFQCIKWGGDVTLHGININNNMTWVQVMLHGTKTAVNSQT
jgi:hypothetical protein